MSTNAVRQYLRQVQAAQAAWAGTIDQGPTYSAATVTYLAAYDAAATQLEASK